MTQHSEVTGKKVVLDAVTFVKDTGIFLYGICRRACSEVKRLFTAKKHDNQPTEVVVCPARERDKPSDGK